jgi:hypothetical protein
MTASLEIFQTIGAVAGVCAITWIVLVAFDFGSRH